MEMTMIALFMLVFGKAFTKPLEEYKKVNGANKTRLTHATAAIVAGLFDHLNLGDPKDANVAQSVVSKSATDYLNAWSEAVRKASAQSYNGKIHAFRAATIATLEAIFVGTDVAKERLSAAYNVLNANGYKQVAQRILAVFASSVETDEKGEITVTRADTTADLLVGIYTETPEYYAQRISVLLCHDIDYKVNDKNEVSSIEDGYARDKADGDLMRFMWKRSTLKSAKSNTAKKASKTTSIADLTAENSGDVIKALAELAKTDEATKNALIAIGMKLLHNL